MYSAGLLCKSHPPRRMGFFYQPKITPHATSATMIVTPMMTPIAVLFVIRFSLGEQSPLSPLTANHVATEQGTSHATRRTITPLISIGRCFLSNFLLSQIIYPTHHSFGASLPICRKTIRAQDCTMI